MPVMVVCLALYFGMQAVGLPLVEVPGFDVEPADEDFDVLAEPPAEDVVGFEVLADTELLFEVGFEVLADTELLFEVLAAVLDAVNVIEVDFEVLIDCVELLSLVLE